MLEFSVTGVFLVDSLDFLELICFFNHEGNQSENKVNTWKKRELRTPKTQTWGPDDIIFN